jgi:hypothetical protein
VFNGLRNLVPAPLAVTTTVAVPAAVAAPPGLSFAFLAGGARPAAAPAAPTTTAAPTTPGVLDGVLVAGELAPAVPPAVPAGMAIPEGATGSAAGGGGGGREGRSGTLLVEATGPPRAAAPVTGTMRRGPLSVRTSFCNARTSTGPTTAPVLLLLLVATRAVAAPKPAPE